MNALDSLITEYVLICEYSEISNACTVDKRFCHKQAQIEALCKALKGGESVYFSEHTILEYLENKLFVRSTGNFAYLIVSAKSPNISKIVAVG